MSILSGFLKTKRYRLTDDGYKLQSEWTSSDTVEMGDGKTLSNFYSGVTNLQVQTLQAGENVVYFGYNYREDIEYEPIFDIYTDVYGVNPSKVEAIEGILYVYFSPQKQDIRVKVRCL